MYFNVLCYLFCQWKYSGGVERKEISLNMFSDKEKMRKDSIAVILPVHIIFCIITLTVLI